jgi:hypothetical protein
VTRHVREFLDLQATQGLKSSVEELEENDYPDYLARHLIRQIKAVLRSVPAEDRKAQSLAESIGDTRVVSVLDKLRIGSMTTIQNLETLKHLVLELEGLAGQPAA